MAADASCEACRVGLFGALLGEDPRLGGCGHVEPRCEGFGACAGKDNGADGGAGGEVVECGAEFEPHAGREDWISRLREEWGWKKDASKRGSGFGGLRLDEGVQSIRAVYFHVGDIFERVGDLEVFVEWGAGRLSHLESGSGERRGVSSAVKAVSSLKVVKEVNEQCRVKIWVKEQW